MESIRKKGKNPGSAQDESWDRIFEACSLSDHDFQKKPFLLASSVIKEACHDFRKTGQKEPRILCKYDSRENVPSVMARRGLFLLPVRNGHYAVIEGEGYVDIPDIISEEVPYSWKPPFTLDTLDTSSMENSGLQHLDYAYASSLIKTFFDDEDLILTIRGRKYTSPFSFKVGKHRIDTKSVQIETTTGYESRDKLVLVEAKNGKTRNTIIRQLFYPFRHWQQHTEKKICLLFFEKRGEVFFFWNYEFTDPSDYNSIRLVQSRRYRQT